MEKEKKKFIGMTIICVVCLCISVFCLLITIKRRPEKMSFVEQRQEYVDKLKESGEYVADTVDFQIKSIADSSHAAEIKAFFQLDTLYESTASTWDKTVAIAKFVASNIPHASTEKWPDNLDAISLWKHTKEVEPAFNCRLHSILMYELLSSAGVYATFITCMPEDCNDDDCHVVNQVWLPELQKWAMIDADGEVRYATDEKGNLLSLQEIREFYIAEKKICYHIWGNADKEREAWYYAYMAKNTYWFSRWENLHYGQESLPNEERGRYIHLVPIDYCAFYVGVGDIVTADAEKFWGKPE